MVSAIIQARIGSSRLPGKMLLDLNGASVLERVIERVKDAKHIDKIIVATTEKGEDDRLENVCQRNGIDCFRGSENDVLARFYKAALEYGLSDIARITGDCPVIDPEIIDQVVCLYEKEGLDYASNGIPPSYPDGFDAEVFSFDSLKKCFMEAEKQSEREHVTMHMWQNPDVFKQKHLQSPIDLSAHRWTLDNQEDYIVIKEIYEKLYTSNPKFRLKDLLGFFEAYPELKKLNSGITRNEGLKTSIKKDK